MAIGSKAPSLRENWEAFYLDRIRKRSLDIQFIASAYDTTERVNVVDEILAAEGETKMAIKGTHREIARC